MFKVVILVLVVLAVISAIGWGITYYKNNLQGVKTAILPAPDDIAEIIENYESDSLDSDVVGGTVNNTDFPLNLPDGFSISIFAKDLSKPRVMMFDHKGTMLVSIPSKGKVVALPDEDNDGKADKTITVLEKLNNPHGLEILCKAECKLYVAESDGVSIYDYDPITYETSNSQKIIDLPDDGGHSTRTLLFLSPPNEDKLLISVGSSCNVCKEDDWRRSSVLIADHDGNDLKTFASGLRNAVFMTAHPITTKVWATEMGRDYLGDDLPPDEINILQQNKDYGWPICFGANIHDTEFDDKAYKADPCSGKISSFIDIQAHSAPLGLAFVPNNWPVEYQNDLLVSFHGSWNRAEPTGYKIYRYKLDERGNYSGEEDFITGWLTADEKALGRPVDILIHSDGIAYISDDKAGVIYQLKINEL